MFEYHGWATLRETYQNEEIFDEKIDRIVDTIRVKIDEIGSDNGLLDLRACNGEYHLHISGFLNHKSQRATEVLDLYEMVAQLAIGSYGMLYIRDDEDMNGQDNEFQVYVLAKGKLKKAKDTLLSPYVPTVEE